jgi:hypothetical protein
MKRLFGLHMLLLFLSYWSAAVLGAEGRNRERCPSCAKRLTIWACMACTKMAEPNWPMSDRRRWCKAREHCRAL